MFTDTHTHLYSELFDQDRDIVLKNALENGITRFFVPAIDSSYTLRMLDLEKKYPKNVFLMTGLHPTSVRENYEKELTHVQNQLKQRKYFAIGEIGIDLYWDKTFLKEQQDAFIRQIHLAKQYQLPIVIHSRESFDEIFEILEKEKSPELKGVFHCFTGTLEQAIKAIDLNMFLGIGGVVTFKNGKIDQFLKEIPLEHILLETDAPFLAPVPFRGKRNESSYLRFVAMKLVDIYSKDLSEIARITTENSVKLFGV